MKKNMTDMSMYTVTRRKSLDNIIARCMAAVMAAMLLLAVSVEWFNNNTAIMSFSLDQSTVQLWTADSLKVWGGRDSCWTR